MSNFTIPRDGAVNLMFDTEPSCVADPENTLHMYILNQIPGHEVIQSAQGIEPNNDWQAPSCKNVYDHCVKGVNSTDGAQVVSTALHVESMSVKDSDTGDVNYHVNNDGELTAKKVATKTAEHVIENLAVKLICDAVAAEATGQKTWTLKQTSGDVNFIHSGSEAQTIAGSLGVGDISAPSVTATGTVSGATLSGTAVNATNVTATGTVSSAIVKAANRVVTATIYSNDAGDRTIALPTNGNTNLHYNISANYEDAAGSQMDILHSGNQTQTKNGGLIVGNLYSNGNVSIKGTSTGATITSSTNAAQRTFNLPATSSNPEILHTGGELQSKTGTFSAGVLNSRGTFYLNTTNQTGIIATQNSALRNWTMPVTNADVNFLHSGSENQTKIGQLYCSAGVGVGSTPVNIFGGTQSASYSVSFPTLVGSGQFVLTNGASSQTIVTNTSFSGNVTVSGGTLSIPTNGVLYLGGYAMYNPTIGTTTATKISGPSGYPTTLNLVYIQKTLIGHNNTPVTAMVYERDIYLDAEAFQVTSAVTGTDNAIYQIDQDWLRVISVGTTATGSEKIAILTDQQTGGRMNLYHDTTVSNRRTRFSITAISLASGFYIQKFKITDYFVQ